MIKSFNQSELETVLSLFEDYRSMQIQDVVSSESQLVFRCHLKKDIHLLFDMKPSAPLFLLSTSAFKLKKKTSPCQLFAKKYFIGSRFISVKLISQRVLFFVFKKKEEEVFIEARLFPHGQNLIFSTADKKISWNKVKEIPESTFVAKKDIVLSPKTIMLDKINEYIALLTAKPKSKEKQTMTNVDIIKNLQKSLSDKSRVEKIEAAILDLKEQRNISQIYKSFRLREDLEWFEALEVLKRKKEHEKSKKEKILKRIDELSIVNIEPRKKLNITSRVFYLTSGKVIHLGRSAKENVKLLRAAKPWFLWLHLRDSPSSYVILEKNKHEDVSFAEIQESANWLVKNSKYKTGLLDGDMFEIQYTECRFVRPIKGDKLGKVSVQNEKVLRIKYEKN